GPDSMRRIALDRYVSTLTRKAPDVSLQALGAPTSDHWPLVIIGQSRPAASTRFTLSRALWHYIWDDSPLFVVTSAHTYRQRVAPPVVAGCPAQEGGTAHLRKSPPGGASQEEVEQIAQR